MSERVNLLGSHYSRKCKADVNAFLLAAAAEKKSGYVCVSNVHTTMMGYYDPIYQKITNESLLSIPDGMPLVWGMKLLGAPEQDRVRGPTLMRDLCDQGRKKNISHYLLGGSPLALEALEAYLLRTYPGISIVGRESPPFRAPSAQDLAEQAQRIRESGAQIVWVGLGAPKQEIWMRAQADKIPAILIGVGAAFDLLPGIIPEAPAWIQAIGMEWLYRLCKEPRRLWRRYLWNNPAFVVLLLKQRFFTSRA